MSPSRTAVSELPSPTSAESSFESLYRANVGVIASFFARRSENPQTVADLTSETFTRAVKSIGTYQGRASHRAWLFAIARAVYAQHHEKLSDDRVTVALLSGRLELAPDDLDDLVDRIDAERAGRELLVRIADLPTLERSAIELVDLSGMTPSDAAQVLGVTAGAVRVRLFRARARLREEGSDA